MILIIIQIVLFVYFGTVVFYIFSISVASLFPIKTKSYLDVVNRKIALIIPGFKEDRVILEVAEDALNQSYPRHLFDVIVIADSFLPQTLEQLKNLPIKLIEVTFENSTKARSINKALSILPEDYEIILILDADNLMEKDFLKKINEAFSCGFTCVQGHRVAKNLDSSMAILDALSEEVSNKLFRKGHRILGLSAALIGSGMAFDYKYYKEIMKTIDAIGGFDKELELILIRNGNIIEYLENALIYDEKVQTTKVFSNQRRRWLSAHYMYFKVAMRTVFHEVTKNGNFNYFIKAVQFASPPRLLLLGFLLIFTIISIFVNEPSFTLIWATLFLMAISAIIFATPGYFYNMGTLKALFKLPHSFMILFFNLFNLKNANKKFIHTQHGSSMKTNP
jgi:cellulose synthase/poly-beta-1,6-N-acetylglucosamine synthase-like glycosyltransferase